MIGVKDVGVRGVTAVWGVTDERWMIMKSVAAKCPVPHWRKHITYIGHTYISSMSKNFYNHTYIRIYVCRLHP